MRGRIVVIDPWHFRSAAAIALFAALSLAAAGCARSTGYKKEARENAPPQTVWEKNEAIDKTKKFAAPKKRTVILPFWNDTPIKGKFSNNAKESLKEMLRSDGIVNIVDDFKISQRSQDFYVSKDKINAQELGKLGRNWSVSLIIIGRISEVVVRKADEDVGLLRPSRSKAAATVEVRLFDVNASKEAVATETVGIGKSSSLNVFGESVEESREAREEIVNLAIEDGLRRAMPQVFKEIDRISWRGRIAKILGGKVYINAGRATGIGVGDILKATTTGADIYDPETGLFLGRTEGEIKGTLEIVDFFGEDGSICRIHSGGNFMEGDLVQLYP